jgi:hypothetical protein
MDQEIRNKLRNVVTQCRKLLEDSVSQELEGKYGIFAKKDQVTADPNANMLHLTDEEQSARKDILDHFAHIKARGFNQKDALDQLIREIAFTHLNRLCAYKMMEAREVYIGGQKFREAVSRGVNSNGVKFYLADHPEDERLFNTGHQDIAYRHFLDWLGGLLSEEIGVLFNPNDPANRLYPRQKVLDEVLDLLNGGGIKAEETELREAWPMIWSQDETIGWVYQYFTPKELRDAARDPKKGGSQAPRNSYELAFRNQFFTPRYVVEFLTDNTLGRIWYEMRRGDTTLKDQCRYMIRRQTEVFLNDGEQVSKDTTPDESSLSEEQRWTMPFPIPHRPKKDPRELRILDPACGSGHFLLYCFDLLITIYEEAYADPDLGSPLQEDYPTQEDFGRDVPRMILAYNLHGIDIDLRCSQIAALALWLRCQRTYQEMGPRKDRPKITRSNFVCAEPMPGEEQLLKEFVSQLEPKLLGQVVEVVFDKMKLAGEAGSLIKIEEEIREAVAEAKSQWVRETTRATDRKGQPLLFTQAAIDRMAGTPDQPSLFDLTDMTDDQFFEHAEANVKEALRQYSVMAQSGERLQRRLFTEDAVRGFAFVDLCQKRYDVVLMNPPFGNPIPTVDRLLLSAYPDYGGDILTAFVSRGVAFAPTGYVGAITSRTAFYLPTFDKWRESTLFGASYLQICADLGADVLDEALVEAFVTVIGGTSTSSIPSIRANRVPALSKGAHMLAVSRAFGANQSDKDAFLPLRADLCSIPKMPVAYSAARQLRDTYTVGTRLSPTLASVQQGMSTKNDFRFLRLAFEVPPSAIGRSRWTYIAKGGDYRPFYDDIHLVVQAHNGFAELNDELKRKYPYLKGNTDWVLHPEADYFFGGLTYPERTTSAFGPRLMPDNCYFSHVGLGILPKQDFSRYALLGWLMSRPVQLQVELQAGSADAVESGSAARHYSKALIESLFIVSPQCLDGSDATLRSAVADAAASDLRVETSRLFTSPSRALDAIISVREAAIKRYDDSEAVSLRIVTAFDEIDKAAEVAFRLDESELLDEEVRRRPCTLPDKHPDEELLRSAMASSEDALVDLVVARCGFHRSLSKKCYIADRRLELMAILCGCHPRSVSQMRRELRLLPPGEEAALAKDVVSYCVGVLFGRWDLRKGRNCTEQAVDQRQLETIPDVPPGMLLGIDGSPAREPVTLYPVAVSWIGLLADEDNSASDDMIALIRHVFDLLWPERADRIEVDVCETLGVKDLREYLRRPGKGGFWSDHVSRYSKSRRNAPIYWLLQSSKRNYALWLYYHRLDKDLFFKALVNYVEPKIRLEDSRLATLRSQKALAGESSKEGKRIAKEVERQEDLISELRDFEDKLRRAADLHLEPDLNDGVVLNIAPLWELVPWKEAKSYWEELLEGKHEWSSIGKQLRQKGKVK